MPDKSELEARIAEAEEVLTDLKARRERERIRLQHAEIDRIEEHLEGARLQVKDLKPAADAAWHEVRQGLDRLLAGLRRLREEFKKRD